MKKVVLIALFGATCMATPALADDQDVAFQAAPPAPARPGTAPTTPTPPSARPAPAAPAAPAAPGPFLQNSPPVPAPPGSSQNRAANIRFDINITDTGGVKPVSKALSLNVMSFGGNASIRNSARIPGGGYVTADDGKSSVPASVVLNVDVRNVNMMDANSIRATVTVEYQPYIPDSKSQPGVISASSSSVLVDGRKTTILVASDPVSDRRTTIEVTATILK